MKKHIELDFGESEKVSQKDLENLKERCNNWERYRTKSNLNTLTLKQRCSILEMTNAKLVHDFNDLRRFNNLLMFCLAFMSGFVVVLTLIK